MSPRRGLPFRSAAVLLPILAAACSTFESDRPFVAPQQADRPLPPAALVDVFAPDETGQWARTGAGATLVLNGADAASFPGWYVLSAPPDPTKAKPDEPVRLLLKRMESGRYLVQSDTNQYGVLAQGGDGTWLLYGTGKADGCAALTAAERQRFHMAAEGCRVPDLADLERLFDHVMARHPAPDLAVVPHETR